MFGTVFMALEGWLSAAAVAHIYGKGPHEEDEYLSVNGREYSRQAVIGDGVSAEILRTFSLCVSRALPEVVRTLRISVPLSTLELSLVKLTYPIMMHVTWFACYALVSMFSLQASRAYVWLLFLFQGEHSKPTIVGESKHCFRN